MFLSLLEIDVGDNPDRPRPGRAWLRNLYHVHQRLCMAFPSKKDADLHFLAPYRPEDFPEQRHLADRGPEQAGQQVLAQMQDYPELRELADQPAKDVGKVALEHVHAQRSNGRGFLFRIDPRAGGGVAILVQSSISPDWGYAFHNAGCLLAALPQVKPFDPDFSAGEKLRFRLVANPTRKATTNEANGRRKGKRFPVPPDEFYQWLDDKCQRPGKNAEPTGFSLVKDSVVVQPGFVRVNKDRDGRGQLLRSARYDGVLRVEDPEQLKKTLWRGIGPGKAFGFGLLSLGRMPP